jgi:hypothetical protein
MFPGQKAEPKVLLSPQVLRAPGVLEANRDQGTWGPVEGTIGQSTLAVIMQGRGALLGSRNQVSKKP